MSGFGGFGSGGFGSSQNQNQTGTGFGGFGSTTGQTGAFGSGAAGGFGAAANTTGGGSLFSNTGNTTNTAFGGGGFGQNNTSSPFGQPKPAFGAAATSAGTSLFGGTTATAGSAFGGGGGFGQTGGGFGSTSTGAGFGQTNKPAFGSGGSLFNTTGGGAFGSTAASTSTPGNAFGASGSSPFTGNATNNGTGTTPFSAHTDKDGAGAGSNSYQTITAMPAYSKWSTEELRLVDYAQGRKYGNQNGQPGAFGQSTGFGGFGATTGNTTGFGSTAATTGGAFGATNTSTPFGGTQNTSSGFGASNTGGGLFGAKPAGSTLFGAPAATSAPAGGSLFGGTTGTSFGGAGNTTGFGGTAGGSGFGQTQQPKPAFGAFGSGTATSTGTTGGLFASSGNTAFGGTATNTGFGGTQQNTGTGGFSFGQQNQNQQQQQGQTGGSLFGGFGGNNQQQQQQKPGGLFASTNTGGLFNNQPQQQQQQGGGGLFGNNNNNTAQQGGGLFGAKPAGTGLFANTGGNTGGGGLFGNQQQQQQPQAGGLFSSTNNQQQNTGLFGNRPATASTGLGGSLFSSQQQQQPAMGGSLFGGSQQQQQPTLGGSLFAGSQQQNQPTHLVASLTDNPYGNAQLFAGLQTPTQSVGPLATPLSSSQKTKKQAVIPHYRMMPNASSRLITPQKRPQGFGFSYSTYGTPGSAVSNASPMGLGNSLLGGSSIGRSLGKSLSTSNLRHSFTANESILQPGAFSGAARNGTGSMKKLNINRGLSSRHSLFGTETPTNSNSILSKKVSFENGPNQNGNAAPSRGQSDISGALVRTETGGERPASSTSNGQNTSARNLAPSSAPEMSQVNGSTGQELAIVPENGSPVASRTQPRTENDRAVLTQRDQTLGPYYTEPSISQLQAMSRDQRSNITDFKVGRDGSGSIVFHKVDLTNTPLEQIAGGIVILEVRTATVYGEKSPVPKPPQGGGLNVPSTIVLQNSWPRAKGGRLPVHERLGTRHDKHVVRLKRIQDTEFVNYNSQTGEWTFKVQHYTTYGLDYDDDDSIMTGAVSNASETPTPMPEVPTSNSNRPTPVYHEGESMLSSPESSVDDTFDFKKGKRKILPGQFEDEGFDEDEVMDEDTQDVEVLDGSSQGYETEEEQANGIEGHDMAGSFPAPAENTERHDFHIPAAVSGAVKPKSILKDTHRQGTPSKAEPLVLVHDWTEQLQHTASPKKRDRNALREVQTAVQPAQADQAREDKASKNNNTKSFGTNLDIMRSLFAASEGRDSVKVPEVPSKQRTKAGADPMSMPFHDLTKPSWGPSGTLIYGGPGKAAHLEDGLLVNFNTSLAGVHNDVRFAKFASSDLNIPSTVVEQRNCTNVTVEDGTPRARTTDQFTFMQFADRTNASTPAGQHERAVWQLASILFDNNHKSLPPGLSIENVNMCEMRIRKDNLSDFWKKLVQSDVEVEVQSAKSSEEKAFIYLTGGNIPEACAALLSGMNFHLAQMVAQIGGDEAFRKTVAKQIDDWREINVLSEMNDHIRAIYGLLAGHTCYCEGKTGAGSENKASTFTYSSRFGLDWKRAFGLRLWYGTLELEDLAFAISRLGTDLLNGKEPAKPLPWFFDGNEDIAWNDSDAESREDTLWGLLKLYADAYAEEGNMLTSLESAFAPENTSGNPMDPRLSFQLLNLLRSKGVGTFVNPEGSEKENAIANPDDDMDATSAADQLALVYATRLSSQISSNPDALPVACWVLLHISSAPARTQLIRTLLDQHASILHPGEPENIVTLLTSTTDGGLAIPREWICTSKALYAHAVTHDPVSQARWLIEAGSTHLREAHDVLCHIIGPTAIIERDYDPLREVLGALVATDIARQVDWDKGGGMYFDFVELADLEGSTRRNAGTKKAVAGLVRKLSKSLEAVAGEAVDSGTMERIALQIMAEWVLEIGEREEVLANSRVLRLPLSENAFLAHSKQLSLNYYRSLLTRAT